MHQSIKQKVITSPEQQLLHMSVAEALGQAAALGGAELRGEFTSVQEQLKSIPKKSYR
ncbi:hypothetical protein D3C73_585990 [compost metagenome]